MSNSVRPPSGASSFIVRELLRNPLTLEAGLSLGAEVQVLTYQKNRSVPGATKTPNVRICFCSSVHYQRAEALLDVGWTSKEYCRLTFPTDWVGT